MFGTLSFSVAILYGIVYDVDALVSNAGIVMVIFQFLFVTRLLTDGQMLGIAIALILHVIGSSRPGFADGSTIYGHLQHWDVLTHALTAFVLTVIAWSFVVKHTHNSSMNIIHLSDMYLFVWAATLGIAMSVVWELSEYAIELYLDIPVLVVGSVHNHMIDVFAGVFGAIVAAGWIVATRDEPKPVCPIPESQPALPEPEYVESYTED